MEDAETTETRLNPSCEMEEAGPCKLKIKLEISKETISEKVEEKYRDLNDSVSLPGFRKGHAPRNLLERKFGKALMEDLKTELIGSAYAEVIEEKSIEPMGEPEIDAESLTLDPEAAFGFEFSVETRPKIELKEYTGLKVDRPAVDVTEKDVDEVLERFQASRAEFVPHDGPSAEGDRLVADLTFLCEDKELDKSENTDIAVQKGAAFYNLPLDNFHKEIEGKKAGETLEIHVDLPEDFKIKEAAGKKGLIKVEIKSVKQRQLPKLDQAFAEALDMDSIEELREDVEKRLAKERKAAVEEGMGRDLVDQLVKANDFPLPEKVVESGTEEALRRFQVQLAMQGMEMEEVEKRTDAYRQESKENMVRSLKEHFILEELAKKERIFVTEDQIEERITALAAQQGKWPAEMRAYLEENDMLTQMRRQMREDEVRKFLLEKAEIKDVPADVEKKDDKKGSEVEGT